MQKNVHRRNLTRSCLRYKRKHDFVRAIFDTVRNPLVILNDELKVVLVNKAFCLTFQEPFQLIKNQSFDALGNGQWKSARLLLGQVISRNSQIQDFEVTHWFPYIGRRSMLLSARRVAIEGATRHSILVELEDITQRREAEQVAAYLNKCLKSRSISDELTGLNNRRGFEVLGHKYLELANRKGKGISVIFVDLDGLKRINDERGHVAGDKAIIQTANILKKTFRATDIIARIGGDEFAIVTMEYGPDRTAILLKRLQANIELCRQQANAAPLSLSVGVAHSDPLKTCSINELTARADALMFVEKRRKHKTLSAAHARGDRRTGDTPPGRVVSSGDR